jgi:glutathione S-transferase
MRMEVCTMKLYYTPGVCSLAPHIVLEEAGVAYTLVEIDFRTKTVAGGGDFRSVNPLGYVPALALEDGTVLTEGPAIVQFIADRVPEKGLAPPNGTLERAKLQSWLNFVSTEIHKGFSPLFNAALGEDAKAVFRQRLLGRLAYVEEHLARHAFLSGEAFSVADAYLFTCLRWTVPTKIDLAPFPAIRAYMERVKERPAVRAAMRAEGLR